MLLGAVMVGAFLRIFFPGELCDASVLEEEGEFLYRGSPRIPG